MKGYEVVYQKWHNELQQDGFDWTTAKVLDSFTQRDLYQKTGLYHITGYTRIVMSDLLAKDKKFKKPTNRNGDIVQILEYNIDPYSDNWTNPKVIETYRYWKKSKQSRSGSSQGTGS